MAEASTIRQLDALIGSLLELKNQLEKGSFQADLRQELTSGEERESPARVYCHAGQELFISPSHAKDSPFDVVIGIDGASRLLDSYLCSITMATACACSEGDFPLSEWPRGPLSYQYPFNKQVPWIGLSAEVEGLSGLEERSGGAVKTYPHRYNRRQIEDEVRSTLETFMIKHVKEAVIPELLDRGQRCLVIAHGPIYHYPGRKMFEREKYERWREYADYWRGHIQEREEVVRELFQLDVPVVGFVEDVSRSRYLIRSEEFGQRLSERLGEIPQFHNDSLLVEVGYRRAVKQGLLPPPRTIVRTGTFGAKFEGPAQFPEKSFAYLVFSKHPEVAYGIKAHRVESLQEVYSKFGDDLWNSVLRVALESGVPKPVYYAHRRSSYWCRSLFVYASKCREWMPLTEETTYRLAEDDRSLRSEAERLI